MSVNSGSHDVYYGFATEHKPLSQEHIKSMPTVLTALNHIFSIAEKEERERLRFLENNKDQEIMNTQQFLDRANNEIAELKEVLRLIPDYNRDNRFSYAGEPSPLEQAGKWIKRQLEDKYMPRELCDYRDKIFQIKGERKLKSAYAVNMRETDAILKMPQGYKVVKIVIEKEGE